MLSAWIWQFLKKGRARVEGNETLSSERIYRTGLPQGSVLSPALFLLWSAPLAAALQEVPGTTTFMYAYDTAALCAGNTIEVASGRVQQSADVLTKCAREAKMMVAGRRPRRWCCLSGPATTSTAPR